MSSYEVSQEILGYCTKCKLDLNHVIVALKDNEIAKVQCCTCRKEHKYKKPRGADEVKTKKKASRVKKTEIDDRSFSIEAEWERLMSLHKDIPLKEYHPRSVFVLGDKLKHATFGEGIVGRFIYPNKIEVIFQRDIKILIMSMP